MLKGFLHYAFFRALVVRLLISASSGYHCGLFLIALSGWTSFSWAQQVPVRYIDVEDGLSNNSINAIYQDQKGFIWVGTCNGLNRYEGNEFKIFKNGIADSLSLKDNYVYCLTGDINNNLWIGGPRGACMFNQNNGIFHTLSYKEDIGTKTLELKDAVPKIECLGSDVILAGSQTQGLIRYLTGNSLGTKVPLKVDGYYIRNYEVGAIERSEDSANCLVFVNNVGLCQYNLKANELSLIDIRIHQANCIYKDDHGTWLGSNEGLFFMSSDRREAPLNLMQSKISVTKITSGDPGVLWIATDGSGIFQLEEISKTIAPVTNAYPPLLKSMAVMDICKDKYGNKWLGTLRGGITFVPATFLDFNHVIYNKANDASPSLNYILSFCEDDKKNIWIGTDGAGLRYWNRKNNNSKTYVKNFKPNGLTSNYITSIACDWKQAIWIGTWGGGVNKLDPTSGQIKSYKCYNPLSQATEDNIWLVFEDSKRNLWASTMPSGHLFLFDHASQHFKLFIDEPLDLLCIMESKDGKLWAGNYSSFICIDTKNKTWEKKFIGYPVRSILQKDKDHFWVGTSEGGLILYDIKKNTYRRFTAADGLPGNTILRILEDNDKMLWLSSYNGLSRFDYKKELFSNYSVKDGLQSDHFNYNAGLALSTGELIFGGINGLNLFYPEKISGLNSISNLVLSGLTVNNQPVESNSPLVASAPLSIIETLQLAYDQTTLGIDFVDLDYTNNDKTQYSYILEGWDHHWNFPGLGHKANYTRLLEGSYTFKVRKLNSFGKWDAPVTLLAINVAPPWFRTWWAYVLYGTFLILGIYIYLRYNKYKERLRYELKLATIENKRERELAEKQLSTFTFITHEFRTPLSLIINPVKDALEKDKTQLPVTANLKTAHRNARRLLSLVDQLLLFRKAEDNGDELSIVAVDLQHLSSEVYKCFQHQAVLRGIDFTLEPQLEETKIFGDYEKLEIALFNLLSNAFKYTPDGGRITIALSDTQSHVEISISDTGCGISEDDIDNIFDKFYRVKIGQTTGNGFGIGLFIVKHFVLKHFGTISCKSILGVGSTFKIELLKGRDHFKEIPLHTNPGKAVSIISEMSGKELLISEDTEIGVMLPQTENEHLTEKSTLLVIDDNEDMRHYLKHLFSNNYKVYIAEDGAVGLQLAHEIIPDLIVSDIAMKNMDGLEMCKQMKASDELSHIPIILLTAASSAEKQLEGITLGADGYITKPFDNALLFAKVESLLKKKLQLRKYFLDNITLNEVKHKVPAEYRDFLQRCIAVIEANLDREEFTIKEFAKNMGMSHSSLYKKIKAISGQSANSFIRSIRLRRAAVLLLTENSTIAEIGVKVGIDDPRHFRRKFAELFGMNPSEYIKKYRHSFNKELNIIQK